MSAGSDSENTWEWEANDFAAELLMPRHLFSKDVANVVPKSDSFKYRIPWRGDKVPNSSLAWTALTDRATPEPQELDPYAWLETQQRHHVELFESTHVIPSLSQVLSLVWVVEDMATDE
jgi:hypothetical protein